MSLGTRCTAPAAAPLGSGKVSVVVSFRSSDGPILWPPLGPSSLTVSCGPLAASAPHSAAFRRLPPCRLCLASSLVHPVRWAARSAGRACPAGRIEQPDAAVGFDRSAMLLSGPDHADTLTIMRTRVAPLPCRVTLSPRRSVVRSPPPSAGSLLLRSLACAVLVVGMAL